MSFAQTRSVPSGLDKCHNMYLESRRLNVVCEVSSQVWHSKLSASFCSHSPSQALLWFVEAIAQNSARTGQTPGNIKYKCARAVRLDVVDVVTMFQRRNIGKLRRIECSLAAF